MIRSYILRFYNLLRAAVREWTGEAEYERHVSHCARHNESPLGRGRFFAERLEERYRRQARCC